MAFATICDRPFCEQELLNRKLHFAHGKLSTVAEMSNLYALFCILATVDLNINPGEASSQLIMMFIINTSVLVVCTVLVKIVIMYVTPRLETAIYMSRYDIGEFDQILHDHVIKYMDQVWIVSSLTSTILFGINYIFIIWIKFKVSSYTSATAATAIMTPVLFLTLAFAAYSYVVIKRRNEKVLFNEEEIISGSSKVRYTTYGQVNNNETNSSRWDLVRNHVHKVNKNKTYMV